MNKKNKQLALILAGLVVLFLLIRLIKGEREVRTFKSQLFVLDTTQVNTIKLYPQVENQEVITFTKDVNNWTVAHGSIQSDIPESRIESLLGALLDIKPQRLAARSEDKWSTYQVDDSLGTRVILEDQEGKKLADLVIGKFSYRQAAPQNNFSGGQPNIQGWTYVRNYDEVETYATDGFLSMSFNRKFDTFRDKSLVKANPDNVKRVSIKWPGEGTFTLAKMENDWRMGDVIADSSKVAGYINQFRSLSGSEIDDTFQPSGSGDYQCTISGDNMPDVSIEAFRVDSTYRLRSSLNPSAIFVSDSSGVFSKIFKQPLHFMDTE